MLDPLILVSMMFAGAALGLGGFALGQSVERRRWLGWISPRPSAPKADADIVYSVRCGNERATLSLFAGDVAFTGGYRGPADTGRPSVPPSGGGGGSSLRPPGFAARRKGEGRDA